MAKVNFTGTALKALRLMKRRHRPVAVEKALDLKYGAATKLRRQAMEQGWRFPTLPKTSVPVTVREYQAACRDGGVVPKPQVSRDLAPQPPETAWPHLVDYPLPPTPRSQAAGEQATRLFRAVQDMRYVPASCAGGGERHFARECVEHLALLIAYAPGPRYPDEPRAAAPEPRARFSPPPPSSGMGSPAAQVLEVA